MVTEKVLKCCDYKYICDICDYNTSRKSSYTKHLLTAKHTSNIVTSCKIKKKTSINNEIFICKICEKIYKSRVGLWRHSKKCNKNENVEENVGGNVKSIIDTLNNNDELKDFLIEQNQQNQQKIIEQNQKIIEQNDKLISIASNKSVNNTTNNTTNNNFNLNFFLNETCKDALNIKDFVNQLQVGISDLEETGRLGYAAGISKIFINGLKQLDINQRPVHCSDSKRETIYIKDENQWAKEDVENPKLTNAIRDVANKNIQQISVWTDEHPEYMNSRSRCSDRYMKIVVEAMSGSTPEESDKNYKKIARNITKESVIDK